MKQDVKVKAAFVGFGEVNTPRELIERKCAKAKRQLEARGLNLLWTAPVRDDAEGREASRAIDELKQEDFDVLILCLAGWIPSHTVMRIADCFAHKPILLWGLSGRRERGRFITTADQAGTTALRKPMQDMGFCFKYLVTLMDSDPDYDAVVCFAKAARAAADLRGARIGMMGYRDMNLYATLHDGVSLRSKIGPEVEVFDSLEMAQAIRKLPTKRVQECVESMRKRWLFKKRPAQETLVKAAELYLAVSAKVAERGYEAISLCDVNGVKKLMHFPPAPVFMLLGENEGICTIPENDTLGAVTQLMVKRLTGQIAPYLEFYEFTKKGALMGVPDYVPSRVVSGKITVMPTAFGKLSEGLLNVSKIKTGRVTLSRLTYTGNQYSLHIATGTAQTPRPWEEAGWTPPSPQLPSLEITLDGPVESFIQNVLGQHYILAYGDHRAAISELCALLGVEVIT